MQPLFGFVFINEILSVLTETSLVNVVRHGEKCADSGDDLTKVGYARANYLVRCMSGNSPSVAMPFGRATSVMAGVGKHSKRPLETASPLADMIKQKVHTPCSKEDVDCFVDHVQKHLADKATLVVVWEHEFIPALIESLEISPLPSEYHAWPQSCPSNSFKEPSCCSEGGDESVCYDIIWQINFSRAEGKDGSWKPQSITTLHEGFCGESSCPCAQDLASSYEVVL